jgi:hypothetical protein
MAYEDDQDWQQGRRPPARGSSRGRGRGKRPRHNLSDDDEEWPQFRSQAIARLEGEIARIAHDLGNNAASRTGLFASLNASHAITTKEYIDDRNEARETASDRKFCGSYAFANGKGSWLQWEDALVSHHREKQTVMKTHITNAAARSIMFVYMLNQCRQFQQSACLLICGLKAGDFNNLRVC